MTEFDINKIYQAKLTEVQFNKLSNFIYTNYGIKMPPIKKVMLQSRLHKRLKALRIDNFNQYIKYLFSNENSDEIIYMMDVVSTNKTEFYREASHFEFLENLISEKYSNKHVDLWSAGCSSGEEVYTLAITLHKYIINNPAFDYHIMGSDIATSMLQKASLAIYKKELVKNIPHNILKTFFLKNKDKKSETVRVIPALRRKTTFRRINLIDRPFSITKNFDIIFCRNVLIYFDKITQEKVILNLLSNLKKGGYLFLGHSESLTGFHFNLKQIQTTIFQKL